MVNQNRLEILKWSAWAPTLKTAQDWSSWAKSQDSLLETHEKIDLEFIPANFRRRLSPLARSAFLVAKACLTEEQLSNLELVFSSRLGESDRSLNILTALAKNEKVSPNDFSLSVHNTSTGLFSMAFKNQSPATAISAGADSLAMGLMETLIASKRSDKPVLFIMADQVLSPIFKKNDNEQYPAYALAMLCSPPSITSQANIDITICDQTELMKPDSNRSDQQFISLMKWIFDNKIDGARSFFLNATIMLTATPSTLISRFVAV